MARPKKGKNSIRLNLEVSTRVKERILRIMDLIDADSMSEVIRRALEEYEKILEEMDDE